MLLPLLHIEYDACRRFRLLLRYAHIFADI